MSYSEEYRREVIEHDSFRAGYMHGDQGHECDAFPGEFGNPCTYRAWIAGWNGGHNRGPHRVGHFDHTVAEAEYQRWRAATAVGGS